LGISFDRVAEKYDTTRGYPEHIMDDILNALDRRLEPDDLILDAGMGTGRFAAPLQARGYQIVGIDIAGRMIKKAQEKGVENILRADLLNLPFRDLVFDRTISIHVLHLIKHWRDALHEIGRVTKDEFVSVAFNKEESPAQEIRNAYDRACEELGHSMKHPGMRERELPDVLQPDEVKPIVIHEHPVDVRSLIREFETRTYSSQWTVPEEIHEEAIELLKEQFGDLDQVQGIERISLIVWNADRLRTLSCD
jgi:SAM-dependent methyltransferase